MKNIIICSLVLAPFFITTQIVPMEYAKSWFYALFGKKDATCYLAHLPPEIQNHIAGYLTFHDRETDEECEKDTKNLPSYINGYNHATYLNATITLETRFSLSPLGWTIPALVVHNKKIGYSYSRDCSKIIVSLNGTRFTIFDLVKNKITNHSLALSEDTSLDNDCYIGIALSNDGNLIARICNQTNNLEVYGIQQNNTVLYTKTATGHAGDIVFNKQATKILVYNKDNYLWIPLCSEEEHRTKSKKTLIDYLRQRGVCKNLASSLPQVPE